MVSLSSGYTIAGSSLFGVGRTARPVTASTVGARPIVQVGDRGNDAPWKARKTNFRFSLPSHRPWKSRLGAISTFPPSRRRFGDDALNSEQARPAVHASFIDPKAPPTQRFFATHTKQRGGLQVLRCLPWVESPVKIRQRGASKRTWPRGRPWKWRAVESEENQRQVSTPFPPSLEIAIRRNFHISTAATAVPSFPAQTQT